MCPTPTTLFLFKRTRSLCRRLTAQVGGTLQANQRPAKGGEGSSLRSLCFALLVWEHSWVIGHGRRRSHPNASSRYGAAHSVATSRDAQCIYWFRVLQRVTDVPQSDCQRSYSCRDGNSYSREQSDMWFDKPGGRNHRNNLICSMHSTLWSC